MRSLETSEETDLTESEVWKVSGREPSFINFMFDSTLVITPSQVIFFPFLAFLFLLEEEEEVKLYQN